jgi:hypothetical protein
LIVSPRALNAESTYGVDHSAENHYGLGNGYRSPHERMNDANAQTAAKPTLSVWLIGGLILAAVVLL